MGLNVGDIVVEDGDIFADGVNVAARLEALAEPGGICVSARVQEDAAGKLDLAFEDRGEQQLKNISRPVRVYRVGKTAVIERPDTAATQALALPDKPSVAVLPFTNMSGDPEQEFFADGIAEDVITALSRYSSLFVIARNSSFTYKRRSVDIKQVARELGVRYVLVGSVRKADNRIRITAQLVEVETGKHVWTDRYDRNLADIFAVQDEIAQAVTIAITPAIAGAERQRALRKPPGSLDAWAAYQRGLWHLSKFSSNDNAAAQKFFGQAIDLDPTFAGGYWGLAAAYLYASGAFDIGGLPDAQVTMKTLASQAVALDSGDAEAHSWLGFAMFYLGDPDGALAEVERALALSPNLASAHGVLGATLVFSGRPRDGLAAVQRYLRLDPYDPMAAAFLLVVTAGHYLCREYDLAIEAARRVIRSYPEYPLPYRWLAAALGQTGQIEKARETLEQAIVISPAMAPSNARRIAGLSNGG
jgi:adenylate cyclase